MKKRFNIWMITKWYPNREDPQIGVFIQKHAQAIALNNNIALLYIHSLENLSSGFEKIESENKGVSEIIIYFRKSNSYFKKVINIFRYINALFIGLSILNKKYPKPDLIHSYILLRTGIVSWYLSKRKNIPYVVSEQWSGYVTGKYLKSKKWKKWLTGYILKHASAVSCVSHFLQKRMKDCGLENQNTHITPNIIENISAISNQVDNSQVNVLMVADLVDDIKNISGVIKMISSLEEDIPFTLRIVGGGRDEEKLKNLATGFGLLNKKIFFEGQKPNHDVYEYLKKCNFLIMNSRYETFSLICAEAMSCGKPVLATRCGGPDEFVNSLTGILIEPDNDAQLKKEFLHMIKHFRDFNSGEIIDYANNLFSREKIGESFQALYSTVLKEKIKNSDNL